METFRKYKHYLYQWFFVTEDEDEEYPLNDDYDDVILYHFYVNFVVWSIYAVSLFKPVESLSFHLSLCVLGLIVIVLSIIGVKMFDIEVDSPVITAFGDMLCSFLIYTMITHYDDRPRQLLITTGIGLLLGVVLLIRYYCHYHQFSLTTIVKRLRSGLAITTAIMLLLAVFNLLPVEHSMTAHRIDDVKGDKIANHMDQLKILYSDQWEGLSAQEKLDLLAIVADIEANYLGIDQVKVYADQLKNEEVNGYYNRQTNSVVISKKYMEEGDYRDIVRTVCHECYHAYQYRLVELYEHLSDKEKRLYIFENTKDYADEFKDYHTTGSAEDEDFGLYYSQRCESDARGHSAFSEARYYRRVVLGE